MSSLLCFEETKFTGLELKILHALKPAEILLVDIDILKLNLNFINPILFSYKVTTFIMAMWSVINFKTTC